MQVFSYHVIEAPVLTVGLRLFASGALRRVPGLLHAERFLPMRMGAGILSPSRYRWRAWVFVGLWESEPHLDRFLAAPPYSIFERPGYHVRMRAYRRWGSYRGFDQATLDDVTPTGKVVGLTVARLKLTETLRFARWGKPVEALVRDHPGLVHGAVAFRPLNRFSTFSVWQDEDAMVGMVRGTVGGKSHRDAMIERARRDFHYEFTTLRLIPISEHGTWPGAMRQLPA